MGTSDAGSSVQHVQHVRVLFAVWFSFQIVGGHFLIPILIVTFLLRKARRDATLINFGMTITLTSISNCLLLYTHQYLGPEPNKTLCIVQAATFGASAPMCSVATLTTVVQIRSRMKLKPVRWLPAMLIAPYIVFIIFLIPTLLLGFRRPDTVTRARRTFYCSIESRDLSLVTIAFTSTNVIIAVGLGAMLSYQICNFLRILSQTRRLQISIIPLAIRLILFMMYLFIALLTSLWSIRDNFTYIRDIYSSTLGVVYFLTFGTQRDVFRAWCFWRKDDAGSKTETTETCAQALEDITTLQAPQNSVVSFADAEGYPFSTHYTPKNVHILVSSTRTEG
ncbi:hypothetical protein BC827DRAFT_859959 [Russula dissimulans]|nr:hypothetical protein BC827DRAFT_859959 [Russula dissimulans]